MDQNRELLSREPIDQWLWSAQVVGNVCCSHQGASDARQSSPWQSVAEEGTTQTSCLLPLPWGHSAFSLLVSVLRRKGGRGGRVDLTYSLLGKDLETGSTLWAAVAAVGAPSVHSLMFSRASPEHLS